MGQNTAGTTRKERRFDWGSAQPRLVGTCPLWRVLSHQEGAGRPGFSFLVGRLIMDGRDLQAGCVKTLQRLPVWIIEHVWAHNIMDVREGWFVLDISLNNLWAIIKTTINSRRWSQTESSSDCCCVSFDQTKQEVQWSYIQNWSFERSGDRTVVMQTCSLCVLSAVDSSSWPDVDSQPLSLEDSWRLRVTAAHVFAIMKSRDVQNFGKVLGFLETTHKLLPRLVPAIKHMKILFGLKTMVRVKPADICCKHVFCLCFYLELKVFWGIVVFSCRSSCGCWRNTKEWLKLWPKYCGSSHTNSLSTKISV